MGNIARKFSVRSNSKAKDMKKVAESTMLLVLDRQPEGVEYSSSGWDENFETE